MTEAYLRHHIILGDILANSSRLPPRENAAEYVKDKADEYGYPNTHQMVNAFTELIELTLNGVPIPEIDDTDFSKPESMDNICRACRRCK